MIHRALFALGLFASSVLIASSNGSAQNEPTKLTIEAVGATMSFRTLNLSPAAFELAPGQRRTFRVKPGRYVVVQAPPIEGSLQVSCSDGASSMEYDLSAGESLTCTFTAS